MILPFTGRRAHDSHRRPLVARLTTTTVLAAALLVGFLPTGAEAASAGTVKVRPAHSAWTKIGASRTTSLAQATVTVPAISTIEFGFQFRARSKATGYRAKLGVTAGGAVVGSFSRVQSFKQSTLTKPTSLGFSARAGEKLHLEATVVATTKVKLYLRAWKDGTAKPTTWQLLATDSSKKAVKTAGSTYLWARSTSGSPSVKLAYRAVRVTAFSAKAAAAVGIAKPSVPPPPAAGSGDETFSIGVIPDTQAETNGAADIRFGNRTAWMAANKAKLDLRYVLHTGDMTNWGWLDAPELTRAKAAMSKLTRAGIPYALSVGNHDTRAVGWDGVAGSSKYGGAAYMNNPQCLLKLGSAACKSWLLARQTAEFNQTFPLSGMGNVGGAFEAGKDDNIWTSFTANDTKWLVLTMELWPRAEAVAWAKNVVATHPSYNVIIQTHHYLNGDATISSSNGGYGSNSPKYIYNQIVSKYANVKLVFSGHTGGFTSRSDAPNGNTVVSYLGNDMGDGNSNPVRIVTINTVTGAVTSTVHNPVKGTTFNNTSHRIRVIR